MTPPLTLRTRQSDSSAMYILPALSTATLDVEYSAALVAGPPSPASPPAIVSIVPGGPAACTLTLSVAESASVRNKLMSKIARTCAECGMTLCPVSDPPCRGGHHRL